MRRQHSTRSSRPSGIRERRTFSPRAFRSRTSTLEPARAISFLARWRSAFNFRFSPASSSAALQARVRDILDGHRLQYDLQWTLIGEPFLTPRGSLVDALTASVQSIAGVQPALSTSGGTSDGRFLAGLAREVVEFGPLNDSIHKIDERVRVADLAAAVGDLRTDGARRVGFHQFVILGSLIIDSLLIGDCRLVIYSLIQQ